MLSICVALKNRSRVMADGHELRLFPKCVESIAQSVRETTTAELVVADWDSDDWPLDTWLPTAARGLDVQIVRMSGGFSRGGGLNAAARAARSDLLFFTDADCLLCPGVIQLGLQHLREGNAFFPVLYSFDGPEHRSGWWRHSGFGNCMVTRQIYEQAGGWPEYKQWGKEDEQFCQRVAATAKVVREEVAGFYHQWHPEDILWKDRYAERSTEEIAEITQARAAMRELASIIPAGHSFILVDEARFGVDVIEGRQVHSFLEENGEYAGPPPDDATAIRELERLRAEGARFVAFAWMAFWWLEYYAEFGRYMREHFSCPLENERLVVFDLRSRREDGPPLPGRPDLKRPNDVAAWEKIYLTPISPVKSIFSPVARAVAELTSPGDLLLEAGCGSGTLSAELATAGRRVELCDFSQAILNRASELFQCSGLPRPNVTVCDLTQPLPWPAASVDVVWSSGVLEHWTEAELDPIVCEMARISRKCVISLVPYAGCIFYRLGKQLAEESGRWPYGREIPRHTLLPVFERAGLLDIREYTVWNEWGPRFLGLTDRSLQALVQRWWDSLPADDPARENQGYLLLTVGYCGRDR